MQPQHTTSRKIRPIATRFWSHVDRTTTPDGCWLWTASTTREGYGQIGSTGKNKKRLLAHRLSWELHNGPIPDGLFILHNCPGADNPACVNPAHLRPGTAQQNMDDMVAKGPSGRVVNGKTLKVFQAARVRLIEDHPEMSGKAFRLLAYLETMVEWGNHIPGPTAFARSMGWPERSVMRWYAMLHAAGVVIRVNGKGWYLSPLVGWKGAPASYSGAVRRLIHEPIQRAKAERDALAAAAESPVIEGVVVRDGDAPQ